jgi:hypothetical protein
MSIVMACSSISSSVLAHIGEMRRNGTESSADGENSHFQPENGSNSGFSGPLDRSGPPQLRPFSPMSPEKTVCSACALERGGFELSVP